MTCTLLGQWPLQHRMRLDSLAAAQALLLEVPSLPALHLLAKLQGCQNQNSVPLCAVEGCAALGKLLEPQDCVAHILPLRVRLPCLQKKLRGQPLLSVLILKKEASICLKYFLSSVYEERGKLFFVYGHGEQAKTYLWRTIIVKLRSERSIVLAVASSGIASLLLPGGRTAH
uniref:ATP-dependent DNA helicase n=1 Tax=Ananas comosus var. bracteatus TaxID=296719 RepID=A0A6V7NH47_ANACO|nr:unnamed protein product [Ananas comosus var. bracteatus]